MKRLFQRCFLLLVLVAAQAALVACAAPGGEDEGALHCTVSISCETLLTHREDCNESKRALIPEDGLLLSQTQAAFTEGESVYDVLQRVCRENGIQLEAAFMPLYGSVYVEGIGNLYEFDAGSLSGWMYSVNGWFPNYGCSRYTLADGDTVAWVYTCDLGADVGAPVE